MIEATRMVGRFLSIGTFWKILLANALVVVLALFLAPEALHLLRPDASSLLLFVVVSLLTLLANALLLRLALAPLTELERAAERVASGDLAARAPMSPLADRPLAALTVTFNRMVQSVESQRLQARDVASRAVTDAEESKRRLSRDLRDDSAQALASALIRLRTIKSLDDAAARAQAVDDVRASLADVIEQLRSFAGQLRPSGLDLLGIDQVIESYATDAARAADLRSTITRQPLRGLLGPEAEVEMLRVVQALIDRAVAHAEAVVHVDMRPEADAACVTIASDGTGFVPDSTDRALFALRERASYFGGTIEVPLAAGDSMLRVRFPSNHV